MALQLNLTAEDTEVGMALLEAYARILNISCDSHDRVEFSVGVYVNKAARDADRRPIKQDRLIIDEFDFDDQKSIKKKLYEFMKTLDAYKTATDVLE